MQPILEFAQNHPMLSLFWLASLVALLYSTVQGMMSKVQFVSPRELTLLVNKQDAQLLDIRGAEDFKKGAIAGARNLPLAQLQDKLPTLEMDKSKPIIVVCFAGMSAQGAARQLLAAGFSQVSVLTGGMQKWVDDKLPVVKK